MQQPPQIQAPAPAAATPVQRSVGPPVGSQIQTVDAVASAAMSLSVADVEENLKLAETDQELTDDSRKRLTELCADAKQHLERAEQMNAKSQELEDLSGDVLERAADIERRTSQLGDDALKADSAAVRSGLVPPPLPTTANLQQLELELEKRQADLRQLREYGAQLESQAATRTSRRNGILQRLNEIEQSVGKTRQQVSAPPSLGEAKLLTRVRLMESLCRFQFLDRERRALDAELLLFDEEESVNLLQLERSLNSRRTALWTDAVQTASEAVQRVRNQEAQQVLETAEKDEAAVERFEEETPELISLRSVAERNRQLAEENTEVIGRIGVLQRRNENLRAELNRWKEEFDVTQKKVDTVGLPASMGAMLRNQRNNLPNARGLRFDVKELRPQIEKSQLQQYDQDAELKRLDVMEQEVRRVLRELRDKDSSTPVTATSEKIARALLTKRRQILRARYQSEETHFKQLTELAIGQQQLADLSERFAEYIKERVLWVRSEPPLVTAFLAIREPGQDSLARKWTLATGWNQLSAGIKRDVVGNPIIYFLAAMLFGILFVARPFFAKSLASIAERTRRSSYSHFSPTIRAALIAAVSSLLVPGAFWFLGWRLGLGSEIGVTQAALAQALTISGTFMLPVTLMRQVYRFNGLADAHFNASPWVLKIVRANLRWLPLVFVPLMILGVIAKEIMGPTDGGATYRLFFIGTCFVLSYFNWRVFHPKRGVFREFLDRNEGGWIERLRAIWFGGIVLLPVALAILSAFGYAYSSQELAWRTFLTVGMGVGLYVIRGLFLRLLLVHRRRIAIERARVRYEDFKRKRAEAAALEKESGSANGDVGAAAGTFTNVELPGVTVTAGGIQVEDDPLAELRANTAQSRRLLSTCVFAAAAMLTWVIWSDVFPALGILEKWPVFQSYQLVAETTIDSNGLPTTQYIELPDPVTIADLFIALAIAVVAFIASRDLPGLLEIAVLKRLPLENSVRYAITTLSSYAILLVGLLFASRWLGLHWKHVQWMATALTFGLAFGLQDMFANFVAGVIILFERPVRVGDIVTVDEVTGVVSRVRIRATTVTNWDRKDYIVPNKEFITGGLLNWTLSDHVNRIVINVGVAYGSDTVEAKRVLVEIAKQHSIVVDEPAPMATFEEFAASSLSLVLRCFISMNDMPMRLTVIDDLHSTIDKRFHEIGIEIAFPQQDIHVRDLPALKSDPRPEFEQRNGD